MSAPPAGSSAPSFTFEGRTIPAAAGQSIAAALYAAGVRIFTRSFKYHRPRGLFCVSGDCPNCLMNVDGKPNVRTCTEPARAGQVVRSQNCWPSLNHDFLRVFDYLSYFLPVGFYYKRFHKPRWLWPIFEHVVRHIAGLGRIDVAARPRIDTAIEHLHTDVCIIGGGAAGMAAAREAANAGASVLLLERQPRLGGERRDTGDSVSLLAEGEQLATHPRIKVCVNAPVFGLYEGNLIGAAHEDRLLKVRARQIIVCTGGRERPFLLPNNDLPGIFLSRGVRRLSFLYGVPAGQRAVVLTDNDDGVLFAHELKAQGIAVVALIDRRPAVGLRGEEPLAQFAGQAIARGLVLRAVGSKHIQAVRVVQANPDGSFDPRAEQEIGCDLLCVASEQVPANELLVQAGMRFRFEAGRWRPANLVPGVSAAGGAAGTPRGVARVLEGRLRGAEAAAALGFPVGALAELRQGWEALPCSAAVDVGSRACPQGGGGGKCFVCLCEDVTDKDVQQAIAEGFDGIEPLKRYSTASMGPCQGKMCGRGMTELCAQFTQRDINAVGTTTSRPPLVPVELAVLAADRRHHPIRRTPLHHWHQAHGARWLDAGQWKRPESYGDPAAEVKAVRSSAGLIDVSTLGKIDVIGPDAAQLLDRICLQKWHDLTPGRVRYSAMCTEEGILFDDGIGGCLGPDHYYLTASTGNAEAVFQWLEMWRATWRLNATVVNQTSAFAAMNLAGPHAREILTTLTSLDLSSAAFPYPALRQGEVAGVACRLLRIGFVGELGYEIHCPSAHGWHLWNAILEAGKPFDLRPFGVEAQRILRLEKGHLIVGQDTDALSNPLDAGLDWLVRFEKPAFHGRAALERLKAMKVRARLVGFRLPTTPAGGLGAPPQTMEGCQVIEQGRPAGRVTSMRYSPTLREHIGLAWVPAAKAENVPFRIRFNGTDVAADIVPLPFYDFEGKRLKA
jgi:sarcosine oxidase subunit alpha